MVGGRRWQARGTEGPLPLTPPCRSSPQQIHALDFSLRPTLDQVTELLRARRSVRRFSDEEIAQELLERALTLANHAPSANNSQSNAYAVVQGRRLIWDMVGRAAKGALGSYA